MKIPSLFLMIFVAFCLTLCVAVCGDDDDDSDSGAFHPEEDDDDYLPSDDDGDDDDFFDDDTADDDDDDDDDNSDRLLTDPENVGYYDAVKTTMIFPDPVSGQDKEVDVFFPTTDGETICTDFGLRPAVIFAPDKNLTMNLYESYGTHLATWGYITIIRNNFRTGAESLADLNSEIIDWLLEEIQSPNSLFFEAVDMTRIIAAGHGLGGKVALLNVFRDERIRATIAIDPNDEIALFSGDYSVTPDLMSFINKPGQYFGAEVGGDCVPEDENYAQFYNSANSPAWEYTMLDAGHHAFVDNPNCFACQCEKGTADLNAVKKMTRGLMVAFLNIRIRNWEEFELYLSGVGVDQDVIAGKLTFRDK
jgi:Chlorophyllase